MNTQRYLILPAEAEMLSKQLKVLARGPYLGSSVIKISLNDLVQLTKQFAVIVPVTDQLELPFDNPPP